MRIKKILIEDLIKEKILYKHGIRADEIKDLLLNSPLVLKTREKRYIAIGFVNRFLTVIFEIHDGTALVITSYPSSDAQRKLYKLRRG